MVGRACRPCKPHGLPASGEPPCSRYDATGGDPDGSAGRLHEDRRTLFGRRRSYDRHRLLADAAKAQGRRNLRRAIELYTRVLAVEPDNADLHRRLALLQARTRQGAEAWASYRRAAEGLAQQGFVERAIGVYREAAEHFAREERLWHALADLELQRGRRPDAVVALRTGRGHLRARADRRAAIRLLERARALDPTDFEASFELSELLLRTGQRPRAILLLAALVPLASGRQLRRLRARQLRASPGPRTAWRWLGAVLGAGQRSARGRSTARG
jgi:tetratricopeptide (TPR) repeat protein